MPATQPTFFRNLQALGAVAFHGGKPNSRLDPLAAARERFVATADAQLRMIESPAARGLWFRRNGESVIVTLKNGMTAINREAPTFTLASNALAIKFIKAAKEACAKGEFDALLLATNRVPRNAAVEKKEDSAVQPQISTQSTAPKRPEKVTPDSEANQAKA